MKLAAIADLSESSAEKVYATLRRDGPWLELGLSEVNGTSLGERRIEAGEDCAVLASAAAVVLAAWLSDEHPEFLATLPALAALDAASSAGAPPAEPAAKAPAIAASAPVNRPELPSRRAPAPRPSPAQRSPRRLALEAGVALDAGAGGSPSQTPFAPAVWFGMAWGPKQSGLGVRVGGALIGPRTEPLAGQAVRWTRWPLLVGPYLAFGRGATHFELEAGAALGWLRLEGQNFSPNASRADALFGSYARFRWLPALPALHPFVCLTPIQWFGRRTALATSPTGEPSARDLPTVELLILAGLSLPL
jgi:hypothetical protein